MRNTFPKSERLKSRKLIQELFAKGVSAYHYPIKLICRQYASVGDRPLVQTTVTVPKSKFKKAVDRNRLKRQMRELYRLHKEKFYRLVKDGKVMDCMLIYTSHNKEPYEKMEAALLNIFKKISP